MARCFGQRRARRGRPALVALAVVAIAGSVATACEPAPPPSHPCGTPIQCGDWRQSAANGSGDKVLLVGDSILGAYGLSSDPSDGPVLAAAVMANAGVRARVFTSVGSMFEHWTRGLILSNGHSQSGPITGGSIATLSQGQNPPTKHVVLALGTNDATRVYQGARTPQQITDQVLLAMNQALISSTGCTIMILPAIHGFDVVNPHIAQVRDIIRLVAAIKNNELGRTRVVTADFHQLWVDNGRPASWFQGPGDPHLSATGYGRYLDVISLMTTFAQNGALGC